MTSESLIKQREIAFSSLSRQPGPAQKALPIVNELEGVDEVRVSDNQRLAVTYDVQRIGLQTIEALLVELGFHLDESPLRRLKRALHYFTEQNQRANLAYAHDSERRLRDVFVNRYIRSQHGCRDKRPAHWRRYL